MSLGFTISLLLAMNADPSSGVQRSAVEVFRDACLGGEVRLSSTEARPIKRDKMPAAVRRYESNWPSQFTTGMKRYELMMPEGPGYLVVQTGPKRGTNRYCSVASKHIKYWDARLAVDQNPANLKNASVSERAQMDRMGHHRTISSLGYRIVVRRLDTDYVVMTTLLKDGKNDQ